MAGYGNPYENPYEQARRQEFHAAQQRAQWAALMSGMPPLALGVGEYNAAKNPQVTEDESLILLTEETQS